MDKQQTEAAKAARRKMFLAGQGLGDIIPRAMAADASARRYYRLAGLDRLLLEDAPDSVALDRFVIVSDHLRGLGLSAPEVLAVDHAAGLALIEDFGDGTYTNVLARGGDEGALYELAVDTLGALHANPDAPRIAADPFGLERMLDELSLFTDWFVPACAPGADTPAFRAKLAAMWQQALGPVTERRETLILRDFHVDNLMLLPGREGIRACGLLDFQDAVIGGAEYDLVSLLQDARRDLAPGLEARLLERYCKGQGGDQAAMMERYYLYAAQRHARIAGVFVRLAQRDGKPHYLAFMPRVLRQLDTALAAAGLAEMSALLSEVLGDWTSWDATAVREASRAAS